MSSDEPGPRKRLRVGHVSERGAINAVRTILEGHGLVVIEVEGRSDYGRDLLVDITDEGEVTGAVVGLQVKGVRSFIRDGNWMLPATPKDRRFWADSSVPVFGVLWDPDSGDLRWVNLTEHARRPATVPLDSKAVVNIPVREPLDDESLPAFLGLAQQYVRQASPTGLLDLFSQDDERQFLAVYDCWALGRNDARAFILLRRALLNLSGESLRRAIWLLSHLVPHPDILWHSGNWIPRTIEDEVRPWLRWSPAEIYHLVSAVEAATEDDEVPGWVRGGLGQSLWHLLVEDPGLLAGARSAMSLAVAQEDLDAAFRLLIIAQYRAKDSLAEITTAMEQHPELRSHELAAELAEAVRAEGYVSVY
ncbi:MAG: DUF4365 domain-containing protein [Humibacillus sp.]|nr:DUF4365 domain-containing protein [Humibacillus sp.]MDN5779055.1 DUF4365 domain-containing protein [Humibacillus sp.]